MPQLDSARQIGLGVTLKGVLIVLGNGIAGAEDVRAEFFGLRQAETLVCSSFSQFIDCSAFPNRIE
jgi:hypothetical protein